MKQTQCMWKGCKKTIKVDDSFERSSSGQRMGITICGWCPLHTKAYIIYHNMELKRFGYVTAKVFKENKKEFDRMYLEAAQLALKESKQ